MNRRIRSLATELWLPVLVVVLWWWASARADLVFYPPLSDILQRFQEMWLFDRFLSDVVPSLRNLAVGYVVSALAGVGLGVIVARLRLVRAAIEPIVHFLRSIPPVALVPLAILVLGFGPEMKMTIIAFSAVFATLIATLDGVRAADPLLDEVTQVYRISGRDKLFRVILPAAAPQILSGLQVSLQIAFVVMITSEMLASTEGIGYMTILAQQTFAITDMWSGMLLLGVLGYLLNLLFTVAERRVLHWHIGMRTQATSR
ncbi:ABC transporter permease [Pseudonocardia nigra]|uniref:ABC transporter permease n=1 Tax=Pseudonocardia nigra TaxID=1921578 RepID=UPI001C5ED203|nr:ABC transporter permease [Pseudonocardia nigra]